MTNILENIPAVSTLKFIEPLIGLIVAVVGSLKLIAPDYLWLGALLLAIIVIIVTVQPIIMCRYFEPQKEDTPLQALCKARCSCASMAQVKLDNDSAQYFIYREKGDQIWIAPMIEYKWLSTESDATFRDYLNNNNDNAGRLLKAVKQAIKDKKIAVNWYQRGTPICTDSSNVKHLPTFLKPIVQNYD